MPAAVGRDGRDPLLVAAVVCTVLVACVVVAVGVHLRAAAGGGPAAMPAGAGGGAGATAGATAGGAVRVAGTARPAAATGFTLAELAAGEVSPDRFDAFWDAEVERQHEAACPTRGGPGTTVVTAVVGATPPPHLGEAYVDHAPRVEAALAARRARCA